MSSTRQKLIDTAFELFGRNGFHAIGLDRIIDEVGVSKQTFYNHFESKDELILEVLKHRHRVDNEMMDGLTTELAGRDPRARLEAIFDVLDAWMNKPEWRGCIFMHAAAEFPSSTDPAHQMAATHTHQIVENLQYLATLAGASDPKALASELAVLVEGVVSYRHVTGDPSAIRFAKQTSRLLFDKYLPPVEKKPARVKADELQVSTAV